MKTTRLLFFLILALSIFGCKDEDEPAPTNQYIGCCNIPPVVEIIDNSFILIPNAFTPNGDGINDKWRMHTSNIDFVTRFIIKNRRMETVFSRFNFSAFFQEIEWDGKIDHFGNEVVVGGLYDYEIEFFTIYGVLREVKGSVCSYKCDDNLPAPVENCLFSTQVSFGGNIGFNPDIDNLESDCLQ